jgi:uncharacterized protein YceH (UPF0502 family)
MIRGESRLLDPTELRVIGALLEKQQATPEYYPMTLNALVAACNQRSNRTPVMNLTEEEVTSALNRLENDGFVKEDTTGRAGKWSHKVDWRWELNDPRKAALTVLLLRGPQTAGEVRNRAGRMHEFADIAAAEDALSDMAAPPKPIVELLEREPGQKEPRWKHRLGSEEPAAVVATPRTSPAPRRPELDAELLIRRVERLEQQVRELEAAVFKKGGLPDS